MIKINIYGGPSSGKSTLAAQIYATLKVLNQKVELVREYAKELVYQEIDMKTLNEKERLIILAEQFRREDLLKKNIDFLITDSPMMLTAYFHSHEYAKEIVLRHLNKNEVHLWAERPEKFESAGRSHNEEQSKQIDIEMKKFLSESSIELTEVNGDPEERIKKVLDILKNKGLI